MQYVWCRGKAAPEEINSNSCDTTRARLKIERVYGTFLALGEKYAGRCVAIPDIRRDSTLEIAPLSLSFVDAIHL